MKVPFLGSNGWNAPDFARTADQSIDGAVFVDGFFVDSPNPNVQEFVERYKAVSKSADAVCHAGI